MIFQDRSLDLQTHGNRIDNRVDNRIDNRICGEHEVILTSYTPIVQR